MLTDLIALLPKDGSRVTVSWLKERGFKRTMTEVKKDEEFHKISFNHPFVYLRTHDRLVKSDKRFCNPTVDREGYTVRGDEKPRLNRRWYNLR